MTVSAEMSASLERMAERLEHRQDKQETPTPATAETQAIDPATLPKIKMQLCMVGKCNGCQRTTIVNDRKTLQALLLGAGVVSTCSSCRLTQGLESGDDNLVVPVPVPVQTQAPIHVLRNPPGRR